MHYKLPPQSSGLEEDSDEEEDSDKDQFAAAMAAGAGAATVTENRDSTRLTITPTKAVAAPLETAMVVTEEEITPLLGDEVEACFPRIPANVDFDEMEPKTNDFNLQGIMKIILLRTPSSLVLVIDW